MIRLIRSSGRDSRSSSSSSPEGSGSRLLPVDASSALKCIFGGAFYSVGGGVPGSLMVLRSSIVRLISMGVPVERDDFIVVDDEEPLLATPLGKS